MPQRRELITKIEEIRDSHLLCYVLPDRETFPPQIPGFSTQLAGEPYLFIADHLRRIGKVSHLDLFLYTRGGATDAVWPLVSLLREYCEKLSVIVPFRAHSAGTLVCLGADEVIMTDIAELSPIDPTTGNQFNPIDPANPQNRFGISVEDVAAYFELSEKRAGIKEEVYKLDVLKELTKQVHPLALGNVQRVYMMIRRLARKLLSSHLREGSKGVNIETIIKALTEEFYSHTHSICREEAISLLGDWVHPPKSEEEPAIRNLFENYAQELQLREKFNLPEYMGDELVKDLAVTGGIIESREMMHRFTTVIQIGQRPNLPPGVQIQIPPGSPMPLIAGFSRLYDYSIQRMSWRAENEGA